MFERNESVRPDVSSINSEFGTLKGVYHALA